MFLRLGNFVLSVRANKQNHNDTLTRKMFSEKLWLNQKYHRKDRILCKLRQEKNIMYVCVENPKTSHYVMVLMRAQVLDQKFSKLQKMDSLHFVGANIVKMKPESATELTVRYEREKIV